MVSRRVVLLGILSAGPARAETWHRWRSPRFNVWMEFPARFGAGPVQEDTTRLNAADGAALLVYARANEAYGSFDAFKRFVLATLRQDAPRATQAEGERWLSVSGMRGEVLFHERHRMSRDRRVLAGLCVTCPARLQAEYRPILRRMSHSLTM
ncbi:MAG TPA: hypothetical protein VD970_08070 [Acetobacteraceae bacterium]|nr:hypothetical protein [Acetobacteraceae bacterium]